MFRRVMPSWALVSALLMAAGCGDPEAPLYFPDPASIAPVSFSPPDGAAGVGGDVTLVAEMSDDIDGTRLDEAVVAIESDNGLVPVAPLQYDLRLLSIEPDGVSLEQGLEHVVTVDGLYDTEGRRLDPFSWSFTTQSDTTGPSVTVQFPDGIVVPTNTQVVVGFDEPLDAGQLDSSWLTVPGVTGTVVYDTFAQALIFRPTTAFGASAAFDVTVGDTVVDRFGNPLEGGPVTFSFTTDDTVDTKSPVFDAVAPTAAFQQGDETILVDWPDANDTVTAATSLRYEVRATGPDMSAAGEVVAVRYGDVNDVSVGGLPRGTYTFFIESVDLAGNRRQFPCVTVPDDPCPPRAVSQAGAVDFNKDVRPILENRCGTVNCHDSSDSPGFIDLSQQADFETLLNYVNPDTATPLVVPGDPNVSYLYWKVADEERALRGLPPFPYEGSFMPPEQFPPLTYDEVNLIKAWISQGASEGVAE